MNDCEEIKAACRAAGWDVDNVAIDRDGDWWAYSGVVTGMDDHSVDVGDCYSVTWPEVKAGLLRAVPECPETERAPEPEPTECADDDCHAPRLICAGCEVELPPEKLTWQYHPAHGHFHNQPGIPGADWLCEYCGRRGHDKCARPWANEGGLGIARHDPPAIHDDDPDALDALPGWED